MVPLATIGATLFDLLDAALDPPRRAGRRPGDPPVDLVEVEFGRDAPVGDPTLTCPDCGGVMLERDEGTLIR